MLQEVVPIDIDTIPEMAGLIDEVTRTRRPRAIQREGVIVAVIVPTVRNARQRSTTRLVDTSHLPPIPYRTIEEMMQDRDPRPSHAFTEEEIKDVVDHERTARWRAKNR